MQNTARILTHTITILAFIFTTGCQTYDNEQPTDLSTPDSVSLAYLIYGDQNADTSSIFRHLRREAAHGNARALYELGRYHGSMAHGDSALFYYDEAIERGDSSAIAWAAMIHLRGLHDQPQDIDEYVRLMRLASNRGIEQATIRLDEFLSDLRTTAAEGNSEAIEFLRSLEENGLFDP